MRIRVAEAVEHIRIHNTRNVLDQLISNAKHNQYTGLEPHCDVDDEECLLLTRGATITLPDDLVNKDLNNQADRQNALLKQMDKLVEEEDHWEQMLRQYSPSYIHVTYDGLYTNHTILPNEEEWVRVMNFLGYSTADTLKALSDYVSPTEVTHSSHQSDTVVNMDEVGHVFLNGTSYADLVH